MRRIWCILLALQGALAAPMAAHAWGDEGHEIIGLIAWHFLDAPTRARAIALLEQDSSGLTEDRGIAAEATWADKYRDSDRNGAAIRYAATGEWHYVDIELLNPDVDAACFGHPSLGGDPRASQGPAHDCIIDKIDQFRRELADPRQPPAERLLALQFLLHFVGDLHQPLHAGDDQDRGGNGKRVEAAGYRTGNLHHYWDTVFVGRLGEHAPTVAEELIAEITPRLRREWRAGTATSWAMQSFALAKTLAYGRLPAPDGRGRYALSDEYVREATSATRLQLERAGVRLAALLETALR